MTKMFRWRKKEPPVNNCKHEYFEVGKRLINNTEAFSSHSSIYIVSCKCVKCGIVHRKKELDIW